MIENGEIIEMGTFDELMKSESGYFSEFFQTYLAVKETASQATSLYPK